MPPSCCASTASTPPRPEALRSGRGAGAAPTRRASSSSSKGRGRRSRLRRPACASSSRSRCHRSRACARLSYSAISLFDRCGYRYYAERIVGMQPAPWEPRIGADGAWRPPSDRDRRRRAPAARARRPREPGRARARSSSSCSSGAGIRRCRPRRSRGSASFVRSYTGSALATRIAGLRGVRPERPFAFELDGVLVNGRLDVLWLEGERALVLDYKTNALARPRPGGDRRGGVPDAADRLRDRLPARRRDRGRGRLPLPRGSGRGRLHECSRPTMPRGSKALLSASIARIRAGEFRPTPSAFACSGCPALERRLRRAAARRARRGRLCEPVYVVGASQPAA